MVTIEGRVLGQRRPLFADFSIPPPEGLDSGDGGPLSLRDVITHVVHHEVAAFETRQEARRLDQLLSPEQLEHPAQRGKISPEGRDPRRVPAGKVDVVSAVAVALEAFADGLYLVAIDDAEYRDLDAIVPLRPDSRITFVRLAFLAGA